MNRLASTSRSAAKPARLFVRLPTVIQATGIGRSCLLLAIAVEHLGAAVEGSSGVLTAQALDSDVGQATGYALVLQ